VRVPQLRSHELDLVEMFSASVRLEHISSPLLSRDVRESAVVVRLLMEQRGYDVIGVMDGDKTIGYARRDALSGGTLGDAQLSFPDALRLPALTPLPDALTPISTQGQVFVTRDGAVWGIATLADLQKLPVRLYVFGLVTLIEMNLLRIMRRHPELAWQSILSGKKMRAAEEILQDRRSNNLDTGLDECLQFYDKYTILLKQPWFAEALGRSKRNARHLFGQLRILRDSLAHAHTIRVDCVLEGAALLNTLESIERDGVWSSEGEKACEALPA